MIGIEYKVNHATIIDICSHLEKCNAFYQPPLEKSVNIFDYSKKIAENSITFEAWHEGILVSLLAAYFNDITSQRGFITNVSTLSEFGRLGLAKNLLNKCILYAFEHGFDELDLEVSIQNLKAIALYQTFEFKRTELRGSSVLMKRKIK